MDVSVIIVNWNVKDYLRRCLLSIYKMFEDISFEIIIVDNASNDRSVEELSAIFTNENIRFIQSKTNMGFAAGNKAGLIHAKGRNVLFLNPDTIIVSPGIKTLVDMIDRDESIGILGCRVLNDDLSIQKQCMRHIPSITTRIYDHLFLAPYIRIFDGYGEYYRDEDYNKAGDCECISGCYMLVRRSLLERIGSFSTEFFMYAEDIELCLRAVKNGYRVYYSPKMSIVHYGGKSTALNSSDYFAEIEKLKANHLLFHWLHGRRKAFLNRSIIAAGSIIRIIVGTIYAWRCKDQFRSLFKRHSRIIAWSFLNR